MNKNRSAVFKEIITVLREIGSVACLQCAAKLEADAFQTSTLNLRSLDLKPQDALALATVLAEEKRNNTNAIKSVSFSYNHLMGDVGAIALVQNLPHSVSELGFVSCNIGDSAGREILTWMKATPQLQMICMEGNMFSNRLKMEFGVFKKENPSTVVVI